MKINKKKEEFRWHFTDSKTLMPTQYFYMACRKNGKIAGIILAAVMICSSFCFGAGENFSLELNFMGIALSGFLLRLAIEIGIKIKVSSGSFSEYLFERFYGKPGLAPYLDNDDRFRVLKAFFTTISLLGHFFDLYLFFLLPVLLRSAERWKLYAAFAVLLVLFLVLYVYVDYTVGSGHEYLAAFPFNNTILRTICFLAGVFLTRRTDSFNVLFDKKYFAAGACVPLLFLASSAVRYFLFAKKPHNRNLIHISKLFNVMVSVDGEPSWVEIDNEFYKKERPFSEREMEEARKKKEQEKREEERYKREQEREALERKRQRELEQIRKQQEAEEKKQKEISDARSRIRKNQEERNMIEGGSKETKLSDYDINNIQTDRTRSKR